MARAAAKKPDPTKKINLKKMEKGNVVTRETYVKVAVKTRAELGEQLAGKELELERVEKEKSDANKDWNETIKDLKAECRRLSRIVEDGKEKVEIECQEYLDFSQNAVLVVNPEGEVLERRAMTAEDRQRKLGD